MELYQITKDDRLARDQSNGKIYGSDFKLTQV